MIDNPKKIKPNRKEIAGIEFFEPGRIPVNRLAFDSGKTAIRYYIKLRRQSRS
jgi:hypothetical protein